MGCSKSSSNGEVSGNKSLPEDMRKTPNKQPKLTPKATRKRTTTTTKKSKLSRRNHKDQSQNKMKEKWNKNSKYQ